MGNVSLDRILESFEGERELSRCSNFTLCGLRMDTMLLAVSSLLFHRGCLDILATMNFALQMTHNKLCLPWYFITTKGKETTKLCWNMVKGMVHD